MNNIDNEMMRDISQKNSYNVLKSEEKEGVQKVVNQTLKVKYHDDEMPKLTFTDEKANWIDLYAAEDVEIYQRSGDWVRLGVSFELPKGTEVLIVPSLELLTDFECVLFGETIGNETVFGLGEDGEWMLYVRALEYTQLDKYSKIGRLRLIKTMSAEFPDLQIQEVESFE